VDWEHFVWTAVMVYRLTATLALLCLGAGQALVPIGGEENNEGHVEHAPHGRRPGLFGQAREGHEGGIHEQEDFFHPGKGKGKGKGPRPGDRGTGLHLGGKRKGPGDWGRGKHPGKGKDKGKGKAKKSVLRRKCIGKGGHEMCAKENMFCHKHRMGCVKCPCFEPKDAFDGECPAECAAVVFKPEQPCEKVTDKLVG